MMRGLISALVVLGAMFMLRGADAALIHGKDYQSPNGDQVVRVNSSGQVTTTLGAGEDQTNGVMKVEGQFSYATDDADLVIKSTPGFLHSMTCYGEDAAATAGDVAIRDATAAGAGTIIYYEAIAAAAYTTAMSVTHTFNIIMTAGIVLDFTTTADVFCTVSYR